MEKQTVAVYGDLTALYSARMRCRKRINYSHLDKVLKTSLGLCSEDSFDESNFYTLFSDQNPEQISLVTTLRNLGWNVTTINSRDAHRGKPIDHRFNADIGYDIGLGIEEFDKILVISDSFELARPLQRMQDDDADCQIYLAFFSEALDPRWWPVIRDEKSNVKFIDLDVELYRKEIQ